MLIYNHNFFSVNCKAATRITLAPTNVDVIVGLNATMQCLASHDPSLDLTFIWLLNGYPVDVDKENDYYERSIMVSCLIFFCWHIYIWIIFSWYFGERKKGNNYYEVFLFPHISLLQKKGKLLSRRKSYYLMSHSVITSYKLIICKFLSSTPASKQVIPKVAYFHVLTSGNIECCLSIAMTSFEVLLVTKNKKTALRSQNESLI